MRLENAVGMEKQQKKRMLAEKTGTGDGVGGYCFAVRENIEATTMGNLQAVNLITRNG